MCKGTFAENVFEHAEVLKCRAAVRSKACCNTHTKKAPGPLAAWGFMNRTRFGRRTPYRSISFFMEILILQKYAVAASEQCCLQSDAPSGHPRVGI